MAESPPAGIIRQACDRTAIAAKRQDTESGVRHKQSTAHCFENSGTLRRKRDPHDRDGTRFCSNAHPGAEQPTSPDHPGPGWLLARPISEGKAGAATEISEA